ncbi:MAG TPA: M23 family metallopeptidase [Baekduia sp.]|uniref:M23 family metallopeptidase n=1 Tax=Baekduia sp. TaxID=2600305 RepID=UPI002B77DFD5|nr:M23 family metallopeptidase [Baekduia sp.]HMJ34962.1 M23 family metallopeptidase [Baekduia sp.]
MRGSRRSLLPLSVAVLATAGVALPASGAASVGAASAPAGPRSGGAEFGQPNGRPSAARPVATVFRIGPHTLTEGTAPRLALRIEQYGVRSVAARVAFRPIDGDGTTLSIDLGRVRTGRLLHPAWPRASVLKPGRYVVAVHAQGPAGGTLLRRAHASGRAPLTVRARKVVPPPVVAPPVPPAAPDPGIADDGVFPVAGPHTYGGESARFGAGRTGHVHEGQDVVAAEGVPVVAPLAGTIVARDYQASSAGFYLTLAAADGRSFFFAHCAKDTFAVTLGQAVAAGQQLCRVGHTGDASGPHLHFEIWIGGWRTSKDSHPVDPLAQLQAWDR